MNKAKEERFYHKYSDDHIIMTNYRIFKVCNWCATINEKRNRFCVKCGSEEFTAMSEGEAKLLASDVENRDNFRY